MRIGIDARELFGRPTGVGRYLANLLAAWSASSEARSHSFVLYEPAGAAPGRFFEPGTLLPVIRRPVAGGTGTWWEQVRLPGALRYDPPDVLFAPGYTAPLATAVPIALTIHDLSFLANPAWFTLRERLRRRVLTQLSARRARTVLTGSRFSRDEIVRLLGLPADRVQVVLHAGTQPRKPVPERGDAGSLAERVDGDAGPLVLFVGTIFNRRRVPDLIRAFARIATENRSVRLEVVGDNRTHPHEDLAAVAAESGVAGRVNIRAYVPDETLAALYARAAVFAFLSDYEGFGFTPLEALANGVPPLVLDTAVAREVYGDAAVYVPRGDLAATADAMRSLLVDPRVRQAVLDHAPAVLARYSWERAGRETLTAIERAARPPASPDSPPSDRRP